jgi:hypothetical protein
LTLEQMKQPAAKTRAIKREILRRVTGVRMSGLLRTAARLFRRRKREPTTELEYLKAILEHPAFVHLTAADIGNLVDRMAEKQEEGTLTKEEFLLYLQILLKATEEIPQRISAEDYTDFNAIVDEEREKGTLTKEEIHLHFQILVKTAEHVIPYITGEKT